MSALRSVLRFPVYFDEVGLPIELVRSFSIFTANLWQPAPFASWRHQAARLLSLEAASNELGNLASHRTSKPARASGCYEIASTRSS